YDSILYCIGIYVIICKMNKIRIGIDIGSDGAIAIIKNDCLVMFSRIPKFNDEQDMYKLLSIIDNHIESGDSVHVVIEDLHSVYGSGAASNFSFGLNNGLIIGMLQVSQIPFTRIGPKKWQKEIWQGIRPIEKPVMKKGVQEKDKK